MKAPDIILLVLLAVGCVLALRSIFRGRKKGGCPGCSGCAGCRGCQKTGESETE